MQLHRTPEEFTASVKRLEELAYRNVSHTDEYKSPMEDGKLHRLSYVEALKD